MTGKGKRRKATVKDLADTAREYAALDPPTHGPVEMELDPDLQRIRQTYSIPEVIEMVHQAEKKSNRGPGRPKGKSPSTISKLERIGRLQANGLTLYAIAKKLKMDYGALRKFLHKNRQK